MPKKKSSDLEVYDNVVFQGASVVAGPEDMGILTISTVNDTFGVVLSHDNAEFLIRELQDFVKGRSQHFARDQN